jgi:hypothetical protein
LLLYLLLVVVIKDVVADAPLGGVSEADEAEVDSRSSHTQDATGVKDGVNGGNIDKDDTVGSDDAVDIFLDSSVIDEGDGVDANSDAQRRRFDSTVDF